MMLIKEIWMGVGASSINQAVLYFIKWKQKCTAFYDLKSPFICDCKPVGITKSFIIIGSKTNFIAVSLTLNKQAVILKYLDTLTIRFSSLPSATNKIVA
ncbi:MAG: hypothetical protein ACXVMS_06855 [Flavisolibacter sp.]